ARTRRKNGVRHRAPEERCLTPFRDNWCLTPFFSEKVSDTFLGQTPFWGTASDPFLSHRGVNRAAAPLRRHPGDVRGRVLDVAGLAVDAVRGVDLETRAGPLVHHLVDGGRAVALRRLVVARQVLLERHARIGEERS